MLARQKIKPFMCHKDVMVREAASGYFAKSFDRDPQLMPLVLESCGRYGEQENLVLLSHGSRFRQTESTLQVVLDRLSRTRNRNALVHYNEILAGADVHLLERMLPRIEETRNILLETSSAIDIRLRNAACDSETLLHELFAYSGETAHIGLGEFDFSYGIWIVDELARRDDFDENVLTWLDDEIYNAHDELYAIMLAGRVQIDGAVPVLIDHLRTAGEVHQDYAARSLVRIGTEEVITRLRGHYDEEDRYFRIYVAGIMGDIKLAASEEALLEVFPDEEDATVKTFVAQSLCDLVSERGFHLVCQLIDEEGDDRTAVDLRESLHAACTMCGGQLPEHLRPPRRRNRSPVPWARDHLQRTVGRKIGRNEPCPCGSGNKYKRCCGRP